MLESLKINNLGVICLTEHWQDDDTAEVTHIKGYVRVSNFSRKEKTGNKKHTTYGGSCIYVSQSVSKNSENLTNLIALSRERYIEISAVQISEGQQKNLNVVCVYRPPEESNIEVFLDKFEVLLSKLALSGTDTILMGDINIDNLKESKHRTALHDILESFNFSS